MSQSLESNKSYAAAATVVVGCHAALLVALNMNATEPKTLKPDPVIIELAQLASVTAAPNAPAAANQEAAPEPTVQPTPEPVPQKPAPAVPKEAPKPTPKPPEPVAVRPAIKPTEQPKKVVVQPKPVVKQTPPVQKPQPEPAPAQPAVQPAAMQASEPTPTAQPNPQAAAQSAKEAAQTSAKAQAKAKEATADYFAMISAHLNRNKTYSTEAKKARIEGVVVVRFSVSPSGVISGVSIKRSSGQSVLDNATLELLQRVSPLPAMPKSMPQQLVTVSLPIDYSLTN